MLTHTIPAAFACVVCFEAVAAAGVVEGVEVEAGFAELGAAELCVAEMGAGAGAELACGLSELLDCAVCAFSVERLTASAFVTSVDTRSSARDNFFTLRFIALLLTEMRLTEPLVHQNSGMMAKKAGEVNMEEGQIRWPNGQ